MTDKKFIIPINEKIDKLCDKYKVSRRLTELAFELCVYDEKIYISAQFQVPGFGIVKLKSFGPGALVHGLIDKQIAEVLEINYKLYKNTLRKKFNAYIEIKNDFFQTERIYFKNIKNAREAFEWVESLMIMQKLIT